MGDRLPPRTQGNWEGADWSRHDVPALWSTISQEHDTYTRLQVSAWARTYDVLDAYRAKLEALADALADYWPPAVDTPAALFVRTLADLASNIGRTSHDASGNALALSSVADSLMMARATLESLDYQWQHASLRSSSTQRPALQQQAVSAMTEADQASYDYASALTVSEMYYPPDFAADDTTPLGAEFNVAHAKSPQPTDQGLASGGSSSSSIPAGSRTFPPIVAPPGLAGGSAPSPVTGSPVAGLPVAPPPLPGGRSVPTVGDVMPRGGVFGPSAGETVRQRVPLPTGRSGPGEIGSGRVIGGQSGPATSAQTGHGVSPGLLGTGGAGGGRDRRRRSGGEPYTEWVVARGVPAIFEPPADSGEHDPGPGVWGIDR